MEFTRCSARGGWGWWIALCAVLSTTAYIPQGSAQVDCYIADGCFSVDFLSNEPTIRDCCVGQSNGMYYTSSGGPCTECIVYGFDIPGQPLSELTTFIAEESSSEQYSLPVRMIKGSVASRVDITAEVLPGATADEGRGGDFFLDDKNLRIRPTSGSYLQVTFRVDSVALEPDETFQLSLSSNPPPPAGSFFLNNLDVTIQDLDMIEIKFSESCYSVNERAGEITVGVQTEGRRATDVTVRVTPLNYDDFLSLGVAFPSVFPTVPDLVVNSPNRASTDRDFSSVTHNLTFSLTDSAQTEPELVTISLTNDEINEGGEVFVLMLELIDAVDASRVDLSVRNVSLCHIGDNDPIEIGFEFPSYTYSEADGFISDANPDVIPIFLTKNRDSEQTFEIVVRASTGGFSGGVGNAEHGDDKDYSFGPTDIRRFNFEPSQDRLSLLMQIRQDDLPEGREVARLVSLQVEGSVAYFNPSPNANTTINIDDDEYLVKISLTPEVFEVREDVGTVEFTLTVQTSGPDVRLPIEIFVNLETISGSAGENDYVPITVFSSPLVEPFDENIRKMSFTVTIIDDDVFELTEMFSIMVSPEIAGTVEITPNVGRITILDNDEITFGFTETEVTVGENAGFAPLTVAVLDGVLGTAVSAGLSTMDGSARDTFEYTAIVGQQLEFTSSQLSQQVDVEIIDDNVVEVLLKTFQANLVLSWALLVIRVDAITIAPNVANITIRDDDVVIIGFDRVEYNITENGGFVELSMRILAGRLGIEATVQFNTMDGTAVAGQDYVAVTQDLEFHVPSAYIVTVPITNDTLVETTETFFGVLTLISTETDGIIINPDRTTINIFDQDTTPVAYRRQWVKATIGFSLGTYTVSESAGFVRVTVMVRERQLGRSVFVTLDTDFGSAVSTGSEPDYTHRSVNLQFNQTATVLTVDILITNDTFLEYDEELHATLTTVEDGITLDPGRANINIQNDDFIVVGFDQSLYQIEQGVVPVTLTIRINLIGQLRRDIQVRFLTRQHSAIDGDDYEGRDLILTFTQGDTGKNIDITILGDTVLEPTGVFFAELQTSDPDVRLDTPAAEVQITDSGGSAQVECYIADGCFSVDLLSNEPTIRDCCLGQRNGSHYRSSGGPCTECIVYGFDIPGQPLSESPTFIAEESSSEQYSLPVRMIKGRVASRVDITAEVLPGATADEGQGGDFFLDDKNLRIKPTSGSYLQVTFREDSVALEPDETFQLRLSSNPPPPAGSFFLNSLDMTIQDPDRRIPRSAQVACYIADSCFSVDFLSNEPTIRDCCVGQRNGTHYRSSGGPCTECIVYGFDIPGQPLSELTTFTADESSSEQYSLPVRMIKGRVASRVDITVEVLPGATADEGRGGDFFIDDKFLRIRPTFGSFLQVTFRVDSVALEPDETFQLSLSSNPPPPAGSFFLNNLDMIIQDPDMIEIKFSESCYSVNERAGEITVEVQTEGRRATNVTVRVTPLNYDDFLSLGVALPSDFPTVPELVVNSPNRATTDQDFSSVTHDLTFPPTDSAQTEPAFVTISLTNDEINEGAEVFVVMLELVDAVYASHVDLSVRNVSLCRIGDNDPTEIGFEFPSYTYSEADDFINEYNPDVVPIFLRKSRNSEQTFEIVVRASTGGFWFCGRVGNAEHGKDYSIGLFDFQIFDFGPSQRSIPLLMQILQDDIPEGREAARLVSLQVEGSFADFNPSPNANISIRIDDDGDLAQISLTPEVFEVREDVGTVEFTLTVKTPVRLPIEVYVYLKTVSGSADENDYVPITIFNSPLYMPFDENTREMSFTVTINDDNLFEVTEMFSIIVSPEDPAIVEITPNVGHITILDNDEITFGFNETEVTVGENAGFAPLTVAVLDGVLGTAVSVGLSTVDGSARDTFEYTAIFCQQLLFTSSQLSARVDVEILDDNIIEVLLKTFQAKLVLSGPILGIRSDAITIAPNVATVTIREEDAMLFQLKITGIPDCRQWATVDADAKLEDIRNQLQDKADGLCSCGLTPQHITLEEFRCFASSDEVTYRASLRGTASATNTEILHYLEDWIASGTASVVVQRVRLDIDSSCSPVVINTFDDPECTSEETSSSDKADNSSVTAVIGGVFALLLIIAIIVIVIVVCLVLRRRRRASKSTHRGQCPESFKMTESQVYGMPRPQLPPPRTTNTPGHVEDHEYELVALSNPAYGPVTTFTALEYDNNEEKDSCKKLAETEVVYEAIPGEEL